MYVFIGELRAHMALKKTKNEEQRKTRKAMCPKPIPSRRTNARLTTNDVIRDVTFEVCLNDVDDYVGAQISVLRRYPHSTLYSTPRANLEGRDHALGSCLLP